MSALAEWNPYARCDRSLTLLLSASRRPFDEEAVLGRAGRLVGGIRLASFLLRFPLRSRDVVAEWSGQGQALSLRNAMGLRRPRHGGAFSWRCGRRALMTSTTAPRVGGHRQVRRVDLSDLSAGGAGCEDPVYDRSCGSWFDDRDGSGWDDAESIRYARVAEQ